MKKKCLNLLQRLQLTPHPEVHRHKKMNFSLGKCQNGVMIFNTSESETRLTLGGYFTAAHPWSELTKVLFAYDVGTEQAGGVGPCYPDALTRLKLMTQTIQSTFPRLHRFSDRMKNTVRVLSQRQPVKTKMSKYIPN